MCVDYNCRAAHIKLLTKRHCGHKPSIKATATKMCGCTAQRPSEVDVLLELRFGIYLLAQQYKVEWVGSGYMWWGLMLPELKFEFN